MSASIAFDFYVELDDGEMTWKVTADLEDDGGLHYVDITSARPALETAGDYDVSDLEQALSEERNGRGIQDVREAAREAYVAQFSEAS